MSERDSRLSALRGELLVLQQELEAKCSELEGCEEAIDQLTNELQATQTDLGSSREQAQQSEEILQTLRDHAAGLQRQVGAQWQGVTV